MGVNRKFRKLAAILPPLPVRDAKGNMVYTSNTRQRTGSEILAEKPDAKDGEGDPIEKNITYFQEIKTPKLVDHFEILKDAYKTEGEIGVNTYINLCYSVNNLERPENVCFNAS